MATGRELGREAPIQLRPIVNSAPAILTYPPKAAICTRRLRDRQQDNYSKSARLSAAVLSRDVLRRRFGAFRRLSLTAELQKENARLREALQFIHDTFKRDEDDGYSSRDRQFAIDITKAALAGWHSQDAKPPKGGAVQKELSKEKE